MNSAEHMEATIAATWNEEKGAWEATAEVLTFFPGGSDDGDRFIQHTGDYATCDELALVEPLMDALGIVVPWREKK